MNYFELAGRKVEVADLDSISVRELTEAENATGLEMASRGGVFAIQLFVSLRRDNPEKAAGAIADDVLSAKYIPTLDSLEDDDSPLGAAESEDPEDPPTSGHPPSDSSE